MPITLWCPGCKEFGQPPADVNNLMVENSEFLTPWDKEVILKNRQEEGVPIPKPSDGICPTCKKQMLVLGQQS